MAALLPSQIRLFWNRETGIRPPTPCEAGRFGRGGWLSPRAPRPTLVFVWQGHKGDRRGRVAGQKKDAQNVIPCNEFVRARVLCVFGDAWGQMHPTCIAARRRPRATRGIMRFSLTLNKGKVWPIFWGIFPLPDLRRAVGRPKRTKHIGKQFVPKTSTTRPSYGFGVLARFLFCLCGFKGEKVVQFGRLKGKKKQLF